MNIPIYVPPLVEPMPNDLVYGEEVGYVLRCKPDGECASLFVKQGGDFYRDLNEAYGDIREHIIGCGGEHAEHAIVCVGRFLPDA